VDRDVIDTGFAAKHQTVVVEFPQFVAVAAVPLVIGVMPFVLETHADAVPAESPETLAQNVIQFAAPLGGEEFDDLVAVGDELFAVAPQRVFRVGEADVVRIARVPRILCRLDLLQRAIKVERRKRWS
jgi:hypothetical protein